MTSLDYKSITIYSGPELYEALPGWVAEKKSILEELKCHANTLVRLFRDWKITGSTEAKSSLLEAWMSFYAHFHIPFNPVELTVEAFEEDFKHLVFRCDATEGIHQNVLYDSLLFHWMRECERRYQTLAFESERLAQAYPEYLEVRRAGYEPRLGHAWLTFLGEITRSHYWAATIYPMDLCKINAAFIHVVRVFHGVHFYFV